MISQPAAIGIVVRQYIMVQACGGRSPHLMTAKSEKEGKGWGPNIPFKSMTPVTQFPPHKAHSLKFHYFPTTLQSGDQTF